MDHVDHDEDHTVGLRARQREPEAQTFSGSRTLSHDREIHFHLAILDLCYI